ncbi:MAG: PQQ-dependent sugar dehydrogenase [Steroidobacteraceae bacterium]|nr:PQQ-dependent sugar dehydrogenase [Steroidobacteraceae bacterium]
MRQKTPLTLVPCLICVATLTLAACSREEPPVVAASRAAPSGALPSPETRERNGVDFTPAFENQTRAPGLKTSVALNVETVVEGLQSPWAFEFLPDHRILVTERPGTMRIAGPDGKLSAPVKGLPKVFFEGQGGLLDVALDPQFARNHTIYWSYAEPREGGNGTALAKGVLDESGGAPSVTHVQVIFRQMPTAQSSLHFGSRIVFAPDGTLFLTLGERALPQFRVHAQDLDSHFGKVVRINPDGSVPKDNPFVGRSDAKPEIWSYGHRNIQAAALDANGRLWTIEHGPRGGDELNHPEPGKNYGWPIITYGIEYQGPKVGEGITAREGLEQPVYYWDPVIAPSGMMFYTGDLFPEWQGDLFVGGLGSTKLVRLKLENDRVIGEEWLLQDRGSRIRDVKQGPDGAVYVLAEGPNPSILRITP